MNTLPLYVHIPFCISKCTYCDFFSIASPKCATCNSLENRKYISDDYINALILDATKQVEKYHIDAWKSIYVGGGTPSLLTCSQIKKLFSSLYCLCAPTIDAEISFEANPDDITPALLDCLSTVKVNRISVGIQSFDDKVLSTIGRRSDAQGNRESLKCIGDNWLNKKGNRFSADLIAGLPYQDNKQFLDGISELLSYKCDHISLYSLMLEEGTPLTKAVNAGKVPYNLDKADEQWLLGRNKLEKEGFRQYEVSNFCKKNCESRHNMSYWQLDDYIGIGAGGTGTVTIDATTAFRWTGSQNISQYCKTQEAITEIVSLSERKEEYLMMGFRTLRGVNASEYEHRFNATLDTDIGNIFTSWQKKKLAQKHTVNGNEFWALNTEGLLWLNKFLEEII
jgi:oxygen-independent coproporphyrinogen-3 oxidase